MRITTTFLLMALALPLVAQQTTTSRVMTFNIRLDTPDDGINRWDNRKDWVADLIRNYNPDVFGLQEALYHQIQDVSACLSEWDWVGVGREDGKKAGEFTPVFYKKDVWKLLDSGVFWLSEQPDKPGSKGWDASLPRTVTWVKLQHQASGKHAFFINTHLDHKGNKSKQESVLLILKRFDDLLPSEPMVLMGDLNSLPGSTPYDLLEGSSFSDSHFLSQHPPYGPEGTFNGFQLGTYGGRIDYVFVNAFWKVREHITIADHVDKKHPSDHFPVLAIIALQPDN